MCDSAIVISLYACAGIGRRQFVYILCTAEYERDKREYCSGLYGCEFQFAYNTEQFTLCGTELIMNSGEQLKGQDIKLGIYARTTLP